MERQSRRAIHVGWAARGELNQQPRGQPSISPQSPVRHGVTMMKGVLKEMSMFNWARTVCGIEDLLNGPKRLLKAFGLQLPKPKP